LNLKYLFLRFHSVLLNKKDFFKKLKKERSIKKGVVYFIALTALVLLFLTNRYISQLNDVVEYFYLMTGLETFNVLIDVNPLIFVLFYLFFLVFLTLFSFARYWLVHLTIRLFKSKASYKDTYNSLSYSITPGYVALVFLVFGLFFLIFDKYKILGFAFLVVYVLLEIYSFYIRSKGIADVHDLTLWQGFACLYIYSNILLLVVLIVLLLFLGFTITSLSYFLSAFL
jgi:hypothetical protein